MRVVVQRVQSSSVVVNKEVIGQIGKGLNILVGFEAEDKKEDIDWLTNKILNLRIFSDTESKMNLSVLEIEGEIIVISQFTLHASYKKGNRPSFIKSANPEIAIPLYENFKKVLSEKLGKPIASGEFGADMQVDIQNDGPVTIVMDSKNRE